MPGEAAAGFAPVPDSGARGGPAAYGWAAAVVAAATGVAAAARALLHVPDVEMLFLLGVVVVAVTTRRGPAIFAAALSVAAYDFFFVAPAFTFEVEDARYFLTFAMMLAIGVVISGLTVRLRTQEQAALARERRTAALYEASRAFGAALEAPAVAAACAGAAARVAGRPAVFFVRAAGDGLDAAAAEPPGAALPPAELEVARWTSIQGSPAGGGAGPFPDTPVACLPVRAAAETRGVLAVRLGGEPLRPEARDFLDALCRQAALALERVRLAADVRAASLRAEAEQVRSALLSAVSHDLRTPLAAITGAATAIRDGALDEPTQRELVEAICDEAERLERLVRNLLDMTRLDSGAVQLRREWTPVEEVLGGALARLERVLAGRPVRSDLPTGLPLVPVDPVLLEQLFVNLLENAAKHTPAGTPVEIAARAEGTGVVVEVADRGPGIPAGLEEAVFERFRRGTAAAVPGVGLGLAISRAIAAVHGGTLTAAGRGGGGAVFRLALPVEGRPPGAGGGGA